jgi:hypothetical protein
VVHEVPRQRRDRAAEGLLDSRSRGDFGTRNTASGLDCDNLPGAAARPAALVHTSERSEKIDKDRTEKISWSVDCSAGAGRAISNVDTDGNKSTNEERTTVTGRLYYYNICLVVSEVRSKFSRWRKR